MTAVFPLTVMRREDPIGSMQYLMEQIRMERFSAASYKLATATLALYITTCLVSKASAEEVESFEGNYEVYLQVSDEQTRLELMKKLPHEATISRDGKYYTVSFEKSKKFIQIGPSTLEGEDRRIGRLELGKTSFLSEKESSRKVVFWFGPYWNTIFVEKAQ